MATQVRVEQKEALDDGVRLTVATATPEAALGRVLKAHPQKLKHDAGWDMAVESTHAGYVLRVTDPDGADGAKIRGLGYIGLLAYGPHHQHHHWMMARGRDAH